MEELVELVKSLPEIIEKAAASTLGILALMIIGLAILAVFFFREADVKVKIAIFVMLFFGVVAFGVAVQKVPRSQPPPTLVASIWKVESGGQSTELATKEFPPGAGHGVEAAAGHVPQRTLKEFGEWVSNELKLTPGAHTVHIGVKKFQGPEKLTERVRDALEALEAKPHVQMVDAASPDTEFIISGSVKPTPP